MFEGIKRKLSGETTAGKLDETLTNGLGLPGVYRAEVINRESGRRVNGDKVLDGYDLDYESMTTVGDFRQAVEDTWAEDGLSVRLVSPTDKDGIGDQMHLKTLREAV